MTLPRPLFLSGLMGAGKSTVGPRAAARAGVPFVDLDAEIEARLGKPVARVFAEDGEAAFRAAERDAVLRHRDDPSPRVVALGGGALVDRALRLSVLERACVVTLRADLDELARRAGATDRPLLAGDPRARLAALADARAVAYAESHATVDTTGRDPDAVAADVLATAALDPIAVPLGGRTYRVEVVPGGAAGALARALAELAPTRVVLVTDENVARHVLPSVEAGVLAADADPVRVVLPAGEAHKTLASVEAILRAAVEAPIDRGAVVVAVGGGVLTDTAGLAAALALRGVRWIAVPTTLLSMVDASVGGKTGVDLGLAKNAVGAFHQPSRVVVDPRVTATEATRGFTSGLAEVVKSALLGDAPLWDELRAPGGIERIAEARDLAAIARAVRGSIAVKAAVVGRDERESGERAVLNFGHTVGHALEAEGGFDRLTHGEAVSLGMVAALAVGVSLGVTPQALAREAEGVLARAGLPVDLAAQPMETALRWMGYDKKRQGRSVRAVLLERVGAPVIRMLPLAELAARVLESSQRNLASGGTCR